MSLTLNKILVLCALLISAMLPGWSWAESAWQDSSDTVGEFNGTVPTAYCRQRQHTRLPGQCLSRSCKDA